MNTNAFLSFPFLAATDASGHRIFLDWAGVTGFSVTWQIIVIIFFVLLNGFFVASEFALVKVRTTQLDELIAEGRSAAKALKTKVMVQKLDDYLAATQLGITMASVALSMLGERYIERLIQPFFHQYLPGVGTWITTISFLLAFSILTFLHVVFGELMPKSLAIRRSLQTTMAVSTPLAGFQWMFRWAIQLLNGTANKLLHTFLNIDPAHGHNLVHSAEELQILVAESQRSKNVTATERDISINALELNELVAHDVMTPRTEIIALDPKDDFQTNLTIALESKHTRFPLRERNLDSCLGVVHIKDFLRIIKDPRPDLLKIRRDIIIVPESQPLDELLKTFLSRQAHMALVVDEYGATVGMVTLEDVLEEIVGEIDDEFDSPADQNEFVRISGGEFQVDGKMALYELSEHSDVELESEEVSTIGGYVTSHMGRLPEPGETTVLKDYEVTVTEMNGRRIVRLQFKKLAPEGAEETPAAVLKPAEAEA